MLYEAQNKKADIKSISAFFIERYFVLLVLVTSLSVIKGLSTVFLAGIIITNAAVGVEMFSLGTVVNGGRSLTAKVFAGRFLTGIGLSTNWKDWQPVRGIVATSRHIKANDFIRTSRALVGDFKMVNDVKIMRDFSMALIINKTMGNTKGYLLLRLR